MFVAWAVCCQEPRRALKPDVQRVVGDGVRREAEKASDASHGLPGRREEVGRVEGEKLPWQERLPESLLGAVRRPPEAVKVVQRGREPGGDIDIGRRPRGSGDEAAQRAKAEPQHAAKGALLTSRFSPALVGGA